MIGTAGFTYGVLLIRQSALSTKSPNARSRPQVLVAGRLALGVVVDDAVDDFPVAVVTLGTFQPARSRPLKSGVNPSCAATAPASENGKQRRATAAQNGFGVSWRA